jgi:hypothetical protein
MGPLNNLSLFGLLCPIFGTTLFAIRNTHRVQRASHDVIANTREILNSSAANKHDGVFLQVMSYSGDVSGHFHPVREPNPCDLPESRVRLLRGRGIHPDANTPLLRAAPKCGTLGLCSS